MIKSLGFYRASLLLSLYITQFIGLAFFAEAFVAILRKNGVKPFQGLGWLLSGLDGADLIGSINGECYRNYLYCRAFLWPFCLFLRIAGCCP